MIAVKEKPGGNRASSADRNAHRQLYGKPKRDYLPDNWRQRLPDPAGYYPRHVAKLSAANGQGWAQGRCPFHEDHEASLSVHLAGERGGWKCFAGCGDGDRHHDLLGFHMKRTGLPFRAAVRDLLELPS